jgi:hypothetical protein
MANLLGSVEESPGLKAFWFVVFFVGLKPHASTVGGLPSALSHVPNAGCGNPATCASLEPQVLGLRRYAAPLRMTSLFGSYDFWGIEEPRPKQAAEKLDFSKRAKNRSRQDAQGTIREGCLMVLHPPKFPLSLTIRSFSAACKGLCLVLLSWG